MKGIATYITAILQHSCLILYTCIWQFLNSGYLDKIKLDYSDGPDIISSLDLDHILNFQNKSFYKMWEKTFYLDERRYDDLIKRLSPFFDQNNSDLFRDGEFLRTSYTQNLIYENQNPSNCEDRKYLLISPHSAGIGSALHVYGAVIGVALELNRTAIWSPGANYFWFKGCCPKNNFDCYLQPLSKCDPNVTMDEDKFLDYNQYKKIHQLILNRFVPQVIIEDVLINSSFPKDIWYFYWRIQSIKYLYKLNEATKEAVKNVIKKFIVNPKDSYDVAMHIRHSDKGEEMKLVSAEKYNIPIKLLEKHYKKNLSIFVSSDDGSAIQWFIKNSKHSISYLNYPRRNEGFNQIIKSPTDMALKSFANVEEITKSKYQIGTINSNWVRLLLELHILKGNPFQFFEVGDLCCLNEYQCKLINQKLNYEW